MIYIIDHQDSFTWNVVHQFSKFDKVYCSNYYEIDEKRINQSDTIVFSPGPGSPKDYPLTSRIYKKFKGKKKIIGVCLGYQLILFCENGKIIQQKNKIFHVGRYHSLKLYEPYKSENIKITMRCYKTNIAMAFEDIKNDIYGFQFHPESFLTKNGDFIIKKILSTKRS